MTATIEKTKKPIEELPANPFVFEILQLVDKQKSRANKIEVLQKYKHPCLTSVFIWNFDDNIISMLPEGEVPYSTVGEDLVKSGSVSNMIEKEVEKMNVQGNPSVSFTEHYRTGKTSLRTEHTKFINFIRSSKLGAGNNNLSPLRRENMFIQMLQGLHPLDAEIMCLVKDKKLQTKYKITKELISEAYPEINWGNR